MNKNNSINEKKTIKKIPYGIISVLKTIFKSKTIISVLGLIVLVVLSFLAGMKVDSLILSKTTTRSVSSRPTSNTTAESFSGKVTKIENNKLELTDKDGKTKQFEIYDKTIFTSKEAKVIKSSEIKLGYSMIVYSTKTNDVCYLVRAKVVETSN
ncbi:MAG: hypothetical protein WCK31_00250 [bacterium]